MLAVLKAFVKLQEHFEEATSAIESKQYSKAATALLSMKGLLSRPVHAKENEIKIMSALRTECMVQQQSLIAQLSDLWKDHIVWAVSDVSPTDLKWSELKLLTSGDNKTILQEAVAAMNILGVLDAKVKVFGDKVLKYLITPALQKDCELKVKSSDQAKILQLALKGSEHNSADYVTAFTNISSVLEFLSSNFLCMSVDSADKKSSVTLIEMMSGEISATVVDMVVKDCLSMAIPSNSKDLEKFDKVVSAAEGFQKFLLDLKFLQKENTTLMSYVQNVNVLFANKKCQEIIEQARALMTSEIHDTVAIGEMPHSELPQLDSGPKSHKTTLEMCSETELSGETFKLPRCRIRFVVTLFLSTAVNSQ